MRGETHVVRMLLVVLAVGCFAVGARAQVPRILYAATASFSFGVVVPALDELGLRYTGVVTFEDLLSELRRQDWDLVIIRGKNPFSIDLEGQILDELEAHVARGGALHFQMSRLDEVRTPRYYELLGLEGAVDVEEPLPDIRAPQPVHPSVVGSGFLNARRDLFASDYGDVLTPGAGAFVTQTFEAGGPPSTIIARDGRVIVNGQEWDHWPGGTGFVREQIRWLLSCKADLDGDGDLTVFDFIEFQNLFNLRDVRADVFYDGRYDVFDFLAFFNQFEAGC